MERERICYADAEEELCVSRQFLIELFSDNL